MALTDFFRINFPYGIKRNSKDEWIAFNREYMPLGWNSIVNQKSINQNDVYGDLPIYTKYQKLTDAKLIKLAWGEDGVKRDEKDKIYMIFLYDDGTNPQSNPEYWSNYFDKIKVLANLTIK